MKRIAAINFPAVLLLSACGGGDASGPAPVDPILLQHRARLFGVLGVLMLGAIAVPGL